MVFFSLPVVTATIAGLAGTVGQILILRELLVLFYGNELSTGLVFSCWLLWTALGSGISGRFGSRLSESPAGLPVSLSLLALLLPLTLLWIRASRLIWSIPAGEVLSLGVMLGISLLSCACFCLVSGSVFALAWSVQADRKSARPSICGSHPPVVVYLGEAVGSTMGGLLFYFVLLPNVSALTGTLIVAVLLCTSALATALPAARRTSRAVRLVVALACLLCFIVTVGTLIHEASLNPNDLSGGPPTFRSPTAFQEKPPKSATSPGNSRNPVASMDFSTASGKSASGSSRNTSVSLDARSRKWQWGASLAAIRDTPFHNLALVANSDQLTLFANGLWLFSLPDPQTSEFAVHPALLLHPHPRTVLILGGGVAGLVAEVLKHPGIGAVDYVEPDAEIIAMIRESPAAVSPALSALEDPRVKVFHVDGLSFMRTAPSRYDVVLLNAGEPMNAEMNRFYTVEFYGQIARLLSPGGVFSFGVASAPDIIGPAQARFLRSVYATLRSVFPAVTVYPGDVARFFASDRPESLLSVPAELVSRIAARNLDSQLQYFREYYLFDYLSPMRMNYMASALREGEAIPTNQDFEPTCYLNSLIVWSAQMHPSLEKALIALSGVGRAWFWAGLMSGLALLVFAFRLGRFGSRVAVGISVAVVGGAQMVMEIVLLLSFQILEGFVYTQLALIIPFFMVGIALGAAIVARYTERIARPRRWLVAVQGFLCLYTLGVLGLFSALRQYLQAGYQAVLLPALSSAVPAMFCAIALKAGLLGGLHFSLAVKASDRAISRYRLSDAHAETCVPAYSAVSTGPIRAASEYEAPGISGPSLYALDLVGATAGALIASLFLLPVFGIPTTMLTVAVLIFASLITLAL